MFSSLASGSPAEAAAAAAAAARAGAATESGSSSAAAVEALHAAANAVSKAALSHSLVRTSSLPRTSRTPFC